MARPATRRGRSHQPAPARALRRSDVSSRLSCRSSTLCVQISSMMRSAFSRFSRKATDCSMKASSSAENRTPSAFPLRTARRMPMTLPSCGRTFAARAGASARSGARRLRRRMGTRAAGSRHRRPPCRRQRDASRPDAPCARRAHRPRARPAHRARHRGDRACVAGLFRWDRGSWEDSFLAVARCRDQPSASSSANASLDWSYAFSKVRVSRRRRRGAASNPTASKSMPAAAARAAAAAPAAAQPETAARTASTGQPDLFVHRQVIERARRWQHGDLLIGC